jgi:hypothetical protein
MQSHTKGEPKNKVWVSSLSVYCETITSMKHNRTPPEGYTQTLHHKVFKTPYILLVYNEK